MPLHLLGKKSWNVYNPEAIARVRRDEAEARAREAEKEKNGRDTEAEDRLARLRRMRDHVDASNGCSSDSRDVPRKKRRLAGEDDTDRDIRLARESKSQPESHVASNDTSVMLFDDNGHIDLVQQRPTSAQAEDKSRIQKPVPDELGVKLSDAAGRTSGSSKPWYSSTTADGGYVHETVSKDVWGNEDAGRLQRNLRRVDANDPLAAMKRGVKQLREAETRREEWKSQRERDLNEVEELARTERKRQRRRRDAEEDSLDGFNLDGGYRKHQDPEDRPRHRHKHHHRSRRRIRSRSPPRH